MSPIRSLTWVAILTAAGLLGLYLWAGDPDRPNDLRTVSKTTHAISQPLSSYDVYPLADSLELCGPAEGKHVCVPLPSGCVLLVPREAVAY